MELRATSIPSAPHGVKSQLKKWMHASFGVKKNKYIRRLYKPAIKNSMNNLDLPIPAQGYAGDVSVQLAWQWQQSGQAILVDIRTDAERDWVGFVPGAVPLAFKLWPGMVLNPAFDDGLKVVAVGGKKLVLLCRSGIRSIAAAKRATELGFEAYNILQGFEGDADNQAQRGKLAGWKVMGLPWRQG